MHMDIDFEAIGTIVAVCLLIVAIAYFKKYNGSSILSVVFERPWRRMNTEFWFGGVCAGLAYSIGWPVWVVRLLWFFVLPVFGIGLGAYILLWIFMPCWDHDPTDFSRVTHAA